ncbi:MAG: hypothetical protein ACP5D2_05225 [Candidatus Nanoarchaeia archaeon]
MVIMSLMILVMTLLILTAFIPVIRQSFDEMKGQDNLNCKSTKYVCPTESENGWCYNPSRESETTTCLIVDIFLPYLVIAILLGGVGWVLARGFGPGQSQPQYGGYQ